MGAAAASLFAHREGGEASGNCNSVLPPREGLRGGGVSGPCDQIGYKGVDCEEAGC